MRVPLMVLALGLAWIVHLEDTPAIVLGAAVGPAVVFLLAFWRSGLLRPDSLLCSLATALAGGVLAALPASWLNQTLAELLDRSALPTSLWLSTAVVAPMVEESAKALSILVALLVLPGAISPRTACIRGVCVGLGFTVMENTQYLLLAAIQGGEPRLWQAMYLRGILGGLHHAAFSAVVGAGLGSLLSQAAPSRRRGYSGAAGGLGLHIAWNTFGAGYVTTRLCGAAAPATLCLESPATVDLLVIAPLVSIAGIALAWPLLAWIVRPSLPDTSEMRA